MVVVVIVADVKSVPSASCPEGERLFLVRYMYVRNIADGLFFVLDCGDCGSCDEDVVAVSAGASGVV